MTSAISINERNFEQEVMNHTGTVLVDFYTDSCPPCQQMAPILDRLAEEFADTVKIVKVDASDNFILTEKYNVTSVPTFILFKNGTNEKTKTGIMPPSQLKQ